MYRPHKNNYELAANVFFTLWINQIVFLLCNIMKSVKYEQIPVSMNTNIYQLIIYIYWYGFQVWVFVSIIRIVMFSIDGWHKSHIHGTKICTNKITIFYLIMKISTYIYKIPLVRNSLHKYWALQRHDNIDKNDCDVFVWRLT